MAKGKSGDGPVIEPQPDGPLKVSGLATMLNSRGQAVALKKVVNLCRCGASKSKPFCDGTHAGIGFSDDTSPERVPDRLDSYEGEAVTIRDNRGTCSHAGFCTSGLPAVWRMGTEPWIDPDGAARDDIVETIRKCPSGALSYEEDGTAKTEYHDEPEIRIARDGPYQVRGGVALDGVDFGEGASAEHYTLCRCGRSRNKPFCDGSHWYAGSGTTRR